MTDRLPPLRSLALAAVLCAVLLPAPCLGGESDAPEFYAQRVPAYPNASGARYVDMQCQTLATFNTDDTPESVIDFYRQAMTAEGWNVINLVQRPGQWTMALESGDYRLVISAAQGPNTGTEATLFLGGPE